MTPDHHRPPPFPAPPFAPPLLGGIDLGGTKIEAALFDRQANRLALRRTPTPQGGYPALLAALHGEIGWLSGQGATAIGLGTPGVIDPVSGRMVTANLAASGHRLGPDLTQRAGRAIAVANDAQCFALSEATGGAGQGVDRVFGLVLGTGVGGGLVQGGALMRGATGLGGEVGHFGIPAALAAAQGLPILPCGCGRRGCYETLVSGPGLRRLHRARSGQDLAPAAMGATAAAQASLDLWAEITAELLWTIQLTLDPGCIVLGGGLSNLPDVDARLQAALDLCAFPGIRSPRLLRPRFGDSSGARGAALQAAALAR